ncbi:hypothetical protein ABK040_014128 [Willaertia magna]
MKQALPTKHQVLSLYRNLLKGGNQFYDYNFREYVLRISREDFRKYKDLTDKEKIIHLYEKGLTNLGIVQRQSLINRMYSKHFSLMDRKASHYRENPDLFTEQYSKHDQQNTEEEEE